VKIRFPKINTQRPLRGLFLALVILLLLASMVLASSGDPYDLSWWTVDGGGYTISTGGNYTLSGTIGQPDGGMLSGDNYALAGGFWAGVSEVIQPPECAQYDLNDDGLIDLDDINQVLFNSIFASAPYDPTYDLVPDGVVDIADIFAVAVRFGDICPQR